MPPPILEHKHHVEPAVFLPENLLREARRQRGLPNVPVPEICILDPDGAWLGLLPQRNADL